MQAVRPRLEPFSTMPPPSIDTIASHLTLGANGIWYARAREDISYPSDGNQACFQVEDSSFWFRHRNACIVAAAKSFPPPAGGPIFDIGGGNGFVSKGLMQAGFESVLVEPGEAGAANGKKRGVPTVICATTTSAGFRNATLNAIGLFDVIEHVEDDLSFLVSIRELLKSDGRLYATVPAYAALWSQEDIVAGHFRRYTRDSIDALMQRAGLRVEFSTYIFRPLPLPIYLQRALPHRLGLARAQAGDNGGAADHQPADGMLAALLNRMLAREISNIGAKRPMSFGGSCLVVAQVQG